MTMRNNSRLRWEEEMERLIDPLLGLLKLRYDVRPDIRDEKIRKSDLQTSALLRLFNLTNFPCTSTREQIAIFLGLPQRSVQIWFQNRRQATRKNNRTLLHTIIVEPDRITPRQIIEIILEEHKKIEEEDFNHVV